MSGRRCKNDAQRCQTVKQLGKQEQCNQEPATDQTFCATLFSGAARSETGDNMPKNFAQPSYRHTTKSRTRWSGSCRHFHGRATHVRRASLNASRAAASPVAAAAAAGSSADRNGVLSCCSHHLQSSLPCAGIVSAARELDAYARRATCSKSCAGAGRGCATPAATARSTARGPY